ncbi:MAG: cytochrome c peroxidase [Pseudomonadota bacterium]
MNERAAEVGRLLFFDPILSGNRNIACATCHHPRLGTGDGLSLGLGQGAEGLGPERVAGPTVLKRIPRNAPPLWNLGAREIDVLFHDGRLSVSDVFGTGFNSPVEENLPAGVTSILAAQALFPMVARFEMAGHREDNEVSVAAHRRMQEAWPLVAKRVRSIPEYERMLRLAYRDIEAREDIDIVYIVNALADFMNAEFQSFDSPYDRFLAGVPLPAAAERGRRLFFGDAGCSGCHAGRLLSDQGFHALALPQFGPGRTRLFDPMPRDVGRMGETDRLEDAYRFRTPMLRNVALTAPYGHNGAYATLEGIVRHHLDPAGGFAGWDRRQVVLPRVARLGQVDFLNLADAREQARLRARVDILPRQLGDAQVADLVAFLQALTGTDSVKGRLGVPDTVPSGLKVDR